MARAQPVCPKCNTKFVKITRLASGYLPRKKRPFGSQLPLDKEAGGFADGGSRLNDKGDEPDDQNEEENEEEVDENDLEENDLDE